MDRLVAVDGKDVEGWSHEQVVDAIRKSGDRCSLLVVDQFTDQMYKLVSDRAAGRPEQKLLHNAAILSLTGKGVPSALPRHFTSQLLGGSVFTSTCPFIIS